MLSKKDLNSAEWETVSFSASPTTVVTANGKVQTDDAATVYVKELDLFVTVKLLEDTQAVLSLGNFVKITYTHMSGRVAKNHISLKMTDGQDAAWKTIVFPAELHLHLQPRYRRILYFLHCVQKQHETTSCQARRDLSPEPTKTKNKQKRGHRASTGKPVA